MPSSKQKEIIDAITDFKTKSRAPSDQPTEKSVFDYPTRFSDVEVAVSFYRFYKFFQHQNEMVSEENRVNPIRRALIAAGKDVGILITEPLAEGLKKMDILPHPNEISGWFISAAEGLLSRARSSQEKRAKTPASSARLKLTKKAGPPLSPAQNAVLPSFPKARRRHQSPDLRQP